MLWSYAAFTQAFRVSESHFSCGEMTVTYTLQTIVCTKTWLRQVNKRISYKRTGILDTVLSETSVISKEHANCLINVTFHVRFFRDISKFFYITCFVFYIHESVHRESNLIIVFQEDMTYSVYYFSVRSSTCFRC